MENQDIYDTANVKLNWMGGPVRSLVFESGEMRISEEMEGYLKEMGNFSMSKAFAGRCPELRNVCRCDEVRLLDFRLVRSWEHRNRGHGRGLGLSWDYEAR